MLISKWDVGTGIEILFMPTVVTPQSRIKPDLPNFQLSPATGKIAFVAAIVFQNYAQPAELPIFLADYGTVFQHSVTLHFVYDMLADIALQRHTQSLRYVIAKCAFCAV